MHKEHHIDGAWAPSVTTVLGDQPKPWLDKWRAKWGKRADQKTKAASDIGEAFHDAAEKLAWGKDVEEPKNKRLAKMLGHFETWLTESAFRPVATELHVVSRPYMYAGTFDATGYTKSHPRTLALFDWKTSKGIKPDAKYQLAAYAQAYRDETGIEIKLGYIVHVSKAKPHHVLTVKEYKLGKRLISSFLKRRREFTGVCPEHGQACMRGAA